jgi:hypothetical protein
MGKGSAVVARRKGTKRAPEPSRRLSVQASEAWIAWVEEAADHCRTDVSKFVDAALAAYAREQGFSKPPPKRVP